MLQNQTAAPGGDLNREWEQRVKKGGADFVHFVDLSGLPAESTGGYPCAIVFGKALSKEYLCAIRENRTPKTKEIFNTERKMDALALKIADALTEAGFPSVGKLKTGILPHKTVALRAGLGFIGKNNLLVTPAYGCGVMLGKVLTEAPFLTETVLPQEPQCGSCRVCVDACAPGALLDTLWRVTTTREEILTRQKCTLCHQCMVTCPFTVRYTSEKE